MDGNEAPWTAAVGTRQRPSANRPAADTRRSIDDRSSKARVGVGTGPFPVCLPDRSRGAARDGTRSIENRMETITSMAQARGDAFSSSRTSRTNEMGRTMPLCIAVTIFPGLDCISQFPAARKGRPHPHFAIRVARTVVCNSAARRTEQNLQNVCAHRDWSRPFLIIAIIFFQILQRSVHFRSARVSVTQIYNHQHYYLQ